MVIWIYLTIAFILGMCAQCILTAFLQIHREREQKKKEQLDQLVQLLLEAKIRGGNGNEKNIQ